MFTSLLAAVLVRHSAQRWYARAPPLAGGASHVSGVFEVIDTVDA
jgi:hypothetical protein